MGELYDILKASGLRGGAGSGSGFAPTQEQLDAMNSGIDSTKVAQIEVNETNILSKANTSDVNTAVANLQGQINQIVISSSAESVVAPEVMQARIDADGVVHTTLKDRLDYDANTIRENINYYLTPDEKNLLTSTIIIKGAYVDIIGNIVENALYNYFAVEVTANTEYKICPKARFCCLKVDDTVVQYSEDYTTSFTPTQNGTLYVSLYNSDFPSYKMYNAEYTSEEVYFWNERTLSANVVIPDIENVENNIIDLQDSQEKTNRELAQIITEEKSPNLVINGNNSVGFLQNTGVLDTSLNTYYTTDFIPLEPNTDYVMSVWKEGIKQSYQRFIYMFYNGSKENLPATYNNIDNLSELSINSSTYSYIRICCRAFQGTPSNARFIQFEKGEHASAAYHDYYDYEYANIISSPLKGKTIYSFGDSIAYGADNGIGPCDLVAAKEGMTVVDYSQSGATISWTEAGNVEFGAGCVMRQIDNASEDAPDFVVIIAGVNDLKFTTSGEVADVTSASGTDFFDDNYIESVDTTHPTGALEYCIAKCIEKWSTAQIIFVTEHKMRNHWGDATHIAEPSRDTFRNLISQLKKVCEKWGVSVLDMYTYGGLNLTIPRQIQNYGYQGTDGTHPSTNGYKKYYVPQLIAKMKELVY